MSTAYSNGFYDLDSYHRSYKSWDTHRCQRHIVMDSMTCTHITEVTSLGIPICQRRIVMDSMTCTHITEVTSLGIPIDVNVI